MGNSPSSKQFSQPKAPARPYAERRRGRRLFPLPRPRREPRTLMQLILRQDWQKVLVRAKLFPHEIKQTMTIQLYDIPLRLLPLHLVCALDPPQAVVSLFLKLHPEAATTPISPVQNTKSVSTRSFRSPFRALRKYKRILSSSTRSLASTSTHTGVFRDATNLPPEQFPIDEDNQLSEQSLLFNENSSRKSALLTRWRSYRELDPPSQCDDPVSLAKENDDEVSGHQFLDISSRGSVSSSSMASSSRQSSNYLWHDSLLDTKGVILQLSPSGGIAPFPLGSNETESTSETLSLAAKPRAIFGVQWDLTPLWESMANASSPDNSLLAIHIATLYQASPAVLKQLLDVHPMGAISSVMGMLPIHLASAGWVLEPLVPPPPPPPGSKQPLQPYHHERHPARLKEVLEVLYRVVPESVRIKSGNHGMTPCQYIAEAMEDCAQKRECSALLEPGDIGEERTVEMSPTGPLDLLKELSSTNPSLLFVDSFDGRAEVPCEIQCQSSPKSQPAEQDSKSATISSLLVVQDWEGALSLAEEDPQHAKEWFYGVDDVLDPTIDDINEENGGVWKRLALHMACRYRAPVGLIEVLLVAYPEAATSPDPNCGSLPIHLACQHKASYRVIKSLLARAPTSTKAVDKRGRLPLHYAVLAKAHYAVVELLVEADPSSTLAVDEDGKNPLELAKKAYGRRNVVVRLLEMVTLVLEKSSGSAKHSLAIKKKKERDTVCF